LVSSSASRLNRQQRETGPEVLGSASVDRPSAAESVGSPFWVPIGTMVGIVLFAWLLVSPVLAALLAFLFLVAGIWLINIGVRV
jgi:hypothetical protein